MLTLVDTNPVYVETQHVAAVIRALYFSRFHTVADHLDALSAEIAAMPDDHYKARSTLIIERANYAHAFMLIIRDETPDSLIRAALATVLA